MRVNEIFYSLQGEGTFTGTPSVFVRLSGCNLACPFCDTDFKDYKEYSEEELLYEICKVARARHIVITGGEPTLQLTDNFLNRLIEERKEVQIETNGTHDIQNEKVWITCSPKFEFVRSGQIKLHRIDELKVVYNGENDMSLYNNIEARFYYLQPCDTGDTEKNKAIIAKTVAYCLAHPKWKLSLQTQKILNVR